MYKDAPQIHNSSSIQPINDNCIDPHDKFYWDYEDLQQDDVQQQHPQSQFNKNYLRGQDVNEIQYYKSSRKEQQIQEKKKQKQKQQRPKQQYTQTRGVQQNYNNYEQDQNIVQFDFLEGFSNREDYPYQQYKKNDQNQQFMIEEQSIQKKICVEQSKTQLQPIYQQQQIVITHEDQQSLNAKTKKQNKSLKQSKKNLNLQKYIKNQQDLQQEFQPQKNSQDKKIIDKYRKIEQRHSRIDPKQHDESSFYENKILKYFREQNKIVFPEQINPENIHTFFEIHSRITRYMVILLQDKGYITSNGQDGFYILQIIMGIVKYYYFTKLHPDNYQGLGEIKWINMMKDDLRNTYKIPEVQDALKYIYRFVLNVGQIPQCQNKVQWKNLVKDEKRNFLGYQQDISRFFYKSFCTNYQNYINDFPYLKQNWDFEEKCYEIQNSRNQKSNCPCGKKEFKEFDQQKLKNFMLNHYMRYYLENKQNAKKKKPAIVIDDILNIIVHYEGFH